MTLPTTVMRRCWLARRISLGPVVCCKSGIWSKRTMSPVAGANLGSAPRSAAVNLFGSVQLQPYVRGSPSGPLKTSNHRAIDRRAQVAGHICRGDTQGNYAVRKPN